MKQFSWLAAYSPLQRHALAGAAVIVLLVGGVGGWAATSEISGAVIAAGSVVVDTNSKKVQHPTGGVVGEVLVRDGDRVKTGDLLVRLDETVTRANLAIVVKGLNELYARKARLGAERDGADQVAFPEALTSAAKNPDVAAAMASEQRLFELRRDARNGQKAQLQQQIKALNEDISGLNIQQESKGREIELIERELKGVRELWEKNLVPITRLTTLEREATRIAGERAQVVSQSAQAKVKTSQIALQIIQIDQDLSSEVGKELREVDGKIGEFVERKVTAEDQLRRIDIRSPQDGYVFQSAVHTVGGVISAGDTLMLIVPEADNLAVEIKVNPQQIDQLVLGQTALLRFTTFNQRSTPEIYGTVSRISADTATDQRTGTTYYVVRVALKPSEVARLGDIKLVPGMPVESFVQTGNRTVLSYLAKPVYDQMMRSMRER